MAYTIPGGKLKGRPIAEADDETLNYWVERIGRELAQNPDKPYADRDQSLVAAMNAEKQRRGGGGAVVPAQAQPRPPVAAPRVSGRPPVSGSNQATAMQTAGNDPASKLHTMLWDRRSEIMRLYPREGEAQMQRLVVVAMNGYRKLLANQKAGATPIDPWSVMECVVAAAQLGLEAGTEQAYLVPYKGQCQLIVGPRGLTDIAYRSGFVTSIECETVHANDAFDYAVGDGAFCKLKKATGGASYTSGSRTAVTEVRGPLTHVFCIVKTNIGGHDGVIRKVMTAEDVAFHRAFSQSTSGPWYDNEAAMWRKTCLKQALKTAPRNPLMELALIENDRGEFTVPRTADVTFAPTTYDAMPAAPISAATREAPRLEGVERHVPPVDYAPPSEEDMAALRRIDQGEEPPQWGGESYGG